MLTISQYCIIHKGWRLSLQLMIIEEVRKNRCWVSLHESTTTEIFEALMFVLNLRTTSDNCLGIAPRYCM